MISFVEHWIGWGWLALLASWAAGSVVILTLVYRWFLERFATRIPTAVIFIIWTLAVTVTGGRLFGFAAPAG